MKTMNDMVLHFLQDVYYAERLIVRSLAKTAKAAQNPQLQQAFLEHREQTQNQIARLEQVFQQLGKRARGKTCAAMDGLIDETQEAIDEGEKGPVLDAALIACAQAIEHYEIARYGALAAWARQLDMDEAADLLQQTLDEEKQTDLKLNEIAEGAANQQAAEAGGEDEEAGEDEEEEEEPEEKPAPRRKAAAGRSKAAPAAAPRGRSAAAGAAKKPAARRGSARK
jgi:ferritin-like metal-binding protein YciE